MTSKPDTRLWYQFVFKYRREDPQGKWARGIFHRHTKGEWIWGTNVRTSEMVVKVKERSDAMLLRLYAGDHEFHTPRFTNGYIDFTTNPPSVLLDGTFRDMSDEEVEAAHESLRRELLDDVDEMDDWVQYTYESHGANSPQYQDARIK